MTSRSRIQARSTFRALLPIFVLITACSGGGGGGSDGGDLSITVSPSSLTERALVGELPAQRNLTITPHGRVYLDVSSEGEAIESAMLQIAPDGLSATVAVQLWGGGAIAGINSGAVAIRACEDPACARQIPGSPVIVPVTLEQVAPVLVATPPSLQFGWAKGVTELPYQRLSFAETAMGGTSFYSVELRYDVAGGWLDAGVYGGGDTRIPGELVVTAMATNLDLGTYTGQIRIRAWGDLLDVPVTLDVVERSIFISPHTIVDLYGVRGQPPPAPTIVPLDCGGQDALAFITVVTYADGEVGGWLNAQGGTCGGGLSLAPNRTDLALSENHSNVSIRTADGIEQGVLYVRYNVTY